MFEPLDQFLAVRTWYTREVPDQQRFFSGLKTIVSEHPGFDPNRLGNYIIEKKTGEIERGTLEEARRFYVAAATAVKRYLEAD
jgi:hypothetical protein